MATASRMGASRTTATSAALCLGCEILPPRGDDTAAALARVLERAVEVEERRRVLRERPGVALQDGVGVNSEWDFP